MLRQSPFWEKAKVDISTHIYGNRTTEDNRNTC